MASIIDDFEGAAGSAAHVNNPNWSIFGYGTDTKFVLSGTGSLACTAGNNRRTIQFNTGSFRNAIEFIAGQDFAEGVQTVILTATGLANSTNGLGFFRYSAGTLQISDGGTGIANITEKPIAGDLVRLEVDLQLRTWKYFLNGTQRQAGAIPGADDRALHTYASIIPAHANVPALSDIIRSFKAEPLPALDDIAPVLPGAITVDARSTNSITTTCPEATDNVAVAGYETRVNGGAWVVKGLARTHMHAGLPIGAAHTIEWRARDAVSNYSGILSVVASTFGSGATANTILLTTGPQDGNPAGFLYALAGTVSPGDWLSYDIVSGPTPAGGTLTASPTGAFTYVGPTPATLLLQPQVNGVDVAQITVTLYDATGSLSGNNFAVTPAFASGAIVQGASVPLSGARYAVTPGYTSGSLVQAAAVLLSGTGLAVEPAISRGGIVQDAVLALHGASLAATPALSLGAILEVVQPNYRSMAPSPVCAVYLRDSYRVHNFHKTAGEVLDFDIDFRHELRSTQDSARAAGTVEIDPGPGVVQVLGVYWVPELQRIKLWLSGGRSQNVADLTVWLNTTAGRRLQADVRIYIK